MPGTHKAWPPTDYPASVQNQLVGDGRTPVRTVTRSGAFRPARRPLQADNPTLLISGTFDRPTSRRCAKHAAPDLPNATRIEIPGVGHFTVPHSKCAQDVAASFQSNPKAPDTSCVAGQTMPPFAG